MTVIYSNSGDRDTKVLRNIWVGLNTNVIEITIDMENYEDIVNDAIASENDTLIMCGHGTSYGLLHPNLDSGQYIIHEFNANLIHAQNIIGIWCYAADFAETYNLHGFFTGMFISNIKEAMDNSFSIFNILDIYYYQLYFISCVNMYLRNNTPLCEYIPNLNEPNNDIARFNQSQLRYFE